MGNTALNWLTPQHLIQAVQTSYENTATKFQKHIIELRNEYLFNADPIIHNNKILGVSYPLC